MAEENWKKYIADQATLKEVRDMIAKGLVVKSVQRGVHTFSAGTAQLVVPISTVNIMKCDITFSGAYLSQDTTDRPLYPIRMGGWNNTSLTFQCNVGVGNGTFVNWQVIEYY